MQIRGGKSNLLIWELIEVNGIYFEKYRYEGGKQ